jgi:hypothetical protein
MAQPKKYIPKIGLVPNYGQFFPPPVAGSYQYFSQENNHFLFEANAIQPSPVNAWLMAECSLLVYEEPDFIKDVLSKTAVFGQHSFHWLESDAEQAGRGTAGLLIEGNNFVIIAFRGTEFYRLGDIRSNLSKLRSVWLDLLTDLKIKPKTYTKISPYFDTAIHSGFYEALKSIWPSVINKLDRMGNKPIWLTGHSLGAALATLAAYQFPERLAGLYTFGSPCVGTSKFVSSYKNKRLNQKTFRYVHGNDAVNQALVGFVGYQHVDAVEINYPGRPKNIIESLWNRFIPVDQIDHAPLIYAIQAWNEIP